MTRTMTRMDKPQSFSRRALLHATGALVVSIGAPITLTSVRAAESGAATATKPPLTPDQLSSYIAVNADGTVSAFSGKMDMGQGLSTAFRQMVAEELDVPVDRVKIFIGDTDTSVNQGGASGSTGVQNGGKQMRAAAAEARRVLVGMAADKLGVPADQLTVKDGVISAVNDATRTIQVDRIVEGMLAATSVNPRAFFSRTAGLASVIFPLRVAPFPCATRSSFSGISAA